MVQWVVEAAQRAAVADRVVVATPDQEIADAVRAFGGEVELTRNDHPTGTDRIAEVANRISARSYLNLQGDEPLLPVENIRRLAEVMVQDDPPAASLFVPCQPHEVEDPAVVKVVTDLAGYALYFSRCPIPYPRQDRGSVSVKRHLGVYGYRADTLHQFPGWPQTPLESIESLEQLRLLENGVRIRMTEGLPTGVSVDLPHQASEAEAALLRLHQLRG